MRELAIIINREFQERVHTRSFLIGTLVFPAFMIGVLLLPTLVGDSEEQRRLVVVDRAPAGVGDAFIQALQSAAAIVEASQSGRRDSAALAALQAEPPYAVERVTGEVATEDLNRRVLAREIDGYIVLPAGLLEGDSEVIYRARHVTDRFVLRDLRVAATAAVQLRRLGSAGLGTAEVQQLMDPVGLNTARITEGGSEGGDADTTFLVAYLLAFLAYFVIAMYGHAVMRSVIQEKVTRISEILVSSVRPGRLMAGKIAGVSAAALLQILVWFAIVVLAVSQSDLLQAQFGLPAAAVDAFRLDPSITATLILLFILGFLLYAALFAGLGAAMSTEQEAQPFQMVLMLPLFVPLLFLGPITSDPDGGIATFLSLFPLTSPVAMPMRLAAAPVGAGTVWASLGFLLLATALLAWLAGKIYRIGILATGSRPSLKELARWIRAA
ncbi:MAG: ABC transporter permease [Jiangellaceae bacterium]